MQLNIATKNITQKYARRKEGRGGIMTKISKIYMQTKEEDTDSTKDDYPTKGQDADLFLDPDPIEDENPEFQIQRKMKIRRKMTKN